MTNEQKSLSLQMRADGQTYTAISDVLGVPISTLKSYCVKALKDDDGRDCWRDNERTRMRPGSPDSPDCGTPPTTDDLEAAEENHGSASPMPRSRQPICRQCGEPLKLASATHMRRFCSENCRQKWWRAHKGQKTEKVSTTICLACGETFNNKGNPARRYCSRACYFQARFLRRDSNDQQ